MFITAVCVIFLIKIEQFPDFLKTFLGNLLTLHLSQFRDFRNFRLNLKCSRGRVSSSINYQLTATGLTDQNS